MTSSKLTRVTQPPEVSALPAVGPPVTDVSALVEDVFAAPVEEEVDADAVVEALLSAGRELMESSGIRRLRMDDVARVAGHGRATLYRRFATRDDLVWAIVTREVQLTLLDIGRQLAATDDLGERMVEAFAVTLERVRGNALMRRLLEIEPDLLLPHLTTRGADALDISRRLMLRLLREGRDRGDLSGVDLDVAAEVMVRQAHSMLLTPEGPVDLDDPMALRHFARAFIVEPLFTLRRAAR